MKTTTKPSARVLTLLTHLTRPAAAVTCAALLFAPAGVFGTTLTATGSGTAYDLIAAAGFGNENPDCVHGSFGDHVTQTFDSTLGKYVFVFHSHIDADNDRCVNFDRVRMEIKGGSGSPSDMQHTSGQTAYYRWKFRLASDFIGSSSFTHIFQIKAFNGDDGAPLITITPRSSTLQIIHDSGSGSGSLGVVKEVSLTPFKGVWVEAFVQYKSSEGSGGNFQISLKRVSDGVTLLSYNNSACDMWRTGADYNRPKWGVYRSKDSTKKDEQVRFADFCISESSASSCPSSIGGGGTTVSFEAENLAVTDSGTGHSLQSDANSSGGQWVSLDAENTGSWMEFTTGTINAGTYTFQVMWKGNNNRGITDFTIDGTTIGSNLDQYSSTQTYPTTTVGTKTFSTSGTHKIRMHVMGQNGSSAGFILSADKFTFVAQ
jgi:hypothetical protein